MEKIFDELKKLIAGDISVDDGELEKLSSDYSIFKIRPQAAVSPKNSEDAQKLVKWASGLKKKNVHVSLTARSAGTDMSGGPLNDGVIVSFTQYLNKIKKFGADYVVVEPGVYFRDLERELDRRNLMFPAFPASKDLCAVGGMISNNAGGEKSLVYGKTGDYVESLKMIWSDGKEYEIKPLSAAELKKKIKEKSFESGIYRKIYSLIEKNYDEIKKAKPDVSKNSAGYALWDVWNKKTFDLTKLIVGSQGTLGLITEAKLRLVKKKKFSRLVVVFADTLAPVPKLVGAVLPLKPESIESYDDKTLGIAMGAMLSMMNLIGGNWLKILWSFMPEFSAILKNGLPKMTVLIELSSDDEKELKQKAEMVRDAASRFPVKVRIVKSETEERKYWTIRRRSFALLHNYKKGFKAQPFIDDIIIKPEHMPEVLPKINEILEKHKDKLVYTIAGHPGNGNFHIIPLVNLADPAVPAVIADSMERIYKLVLKYGGSLTAEHNDGLIRGPYLEMMYGKKIYKLFEEVKKIFDPLDIFNPRKKVGVSKNYAFSLMKK